MRTSLAMLLAGVIAAAAWIAMEPGMQSPSSSTTGAPDAPGAPSMAASADAPASASAGASTSARASSPAASPRP